MTGIYNFCKKATITAIYLMTFLVIALTPINAWALNYDLIEGELNGWVDVDDVVLYDEENLSGSLKKIIDADDGCVYIYFQLTDNRIKNTPIENLLINFTIKNNENSYTFSVNSDGMLNEGTSEKKAIKLAQNITKRSTYFYGFIGFELTQRCDRQCDNTITCSYSNGMSEEYILLKNAMLNMYRENKTSTNEATKSKTTTKSSKSSSEPNTSYQTKFVGENKYHTISKNNYVDSGSYDAANSIGEENDLSHSFANTNDQEFTDSVISDFTSGKSNAKKALKGVSLGTALVGGTLIIYGIILNRIVSKKNNNAKLNEEKDDENEHG